MNTAHEWFKKNSDLGLQRELLKANISYLEQYKAEVLFKADRLFSCSSEPDIPYYRERIVTHLNALVAASCRQLEKVSKFLDDLSNTDGLWNFSGKLSEYKPEHYLDMVHHLVFKFTRISRDDPFGEPYFHKYHDHQTEDIFTNVGDDLKEICHRLDWLAGKPQYNAEIDHLSRDRYTMEFMRDTGYIDDHGYCFINKKEKMLQYLSYGDHLTVGIVDPFLHPLLSHTIINTRYNSTIEFKLSSIYCYRNFPIDEELFSQFIRVATDWDDLKVMIDCREYGETPIQLIIKRLDSGNSRHEIIKRFLNELDYNYKQGICLDKYQQALETLYPGTWPLLYDEEEIINAQRRKNGIMETVKQTRGKYFPENGKEHLKSVPELHILFQEYEKYFQEE